MEINKIYCMDSRHMQMDLAVSDFVPEPVVCAALH